MGLRDFTLVEAARSLAEAPSDRTAHEVLARALSETEDAEGARTAAWTQASLRQTPGQWPLPSQFLMPTLPGLDSAQVLSLDEATPLFDRRDVHLGVTAIAGNQSTRGGSVLGGWSTERSQIDLSAFKYQRDGKLASDDASLHAARLHGLWTLAPQANAPRRIQRDSACCGQSVRITFSCSGQLAESDSTFSRAGFWLAAVGGTLATDTEWLAAASRSRVTFAQTITLAPPTPPGSTANNQTDGHPQDAAMQYQTRRGAMRWTLGVDAHKANLEADTGLQFAIPGLPLIPLGTDLPQRYRSTHAYIDMSLNELGPWTLHGNHSPRTCQSAKFGSATYPRLVRHGGGHQGIQDSRCCRRWLEAQRAVTLASVVVPDLWPSTLAKLQHGAGAVQRGSTRHRSPVVEHSRQSTRHFAGRHRPGRNTLAGTLAP